jgi:hypothetical protein
MVRTRQQLAELQAMEDALARLFGTLAGPQEPPAQTHEGNDRDRDDAGQPAAGTADLLAAAALADETARIEASACRCTCALDPGCTCGCPCCAPATGGAEAAVGADAVGTGGSSGRGRGCASDC